MRLTPAGALVIDFGAPLRREGYVRGEWRLGVFNSAWRLQSAGAVLVASGDDPARMDAALQGLRGVDLHSLEADDLLLASSFRLGDHQIRRHLIGIHVSGLR